MKADPKWYKSLINQNNNFQETQNNILLKNNKYTYEKELIDLLLKDFAAADDGRNNDLLKIRLEIDSLAEKGYGKKSKESSNAKYRLGRIYRVLGDYKTAEFYYKECIKIESELKDKDPEFVSDVMNSLGLVLYDQGKYNKAEIEFIESLRIKERLFGRNDISMASAYNNLALVYNAQNLYEKAQYFVENSLLILKKNNVKDERLAHALQTLGSVYYSQRFNPKKQDYFLNKAKETTLKAFELDKKFFGIDDIRTSYTKETLALIYADLNNYKKAELFLKDVLKVRKEFHGLNHPSVSNAYNNLAVIYDDQGLIKKAEINFLKALEISENTLGKYNILTTNNYSNIGSFYLEKNENQKGSKYLKKAVENNLIGIQREMPYLPLDERYFYFLQFQPEFDLIFMNVASGKISSDIGLFARLNNQGLLPEIERKQFQKLNESGINKNLINQLNKITRELSSIKTGTKEWINKNVIKMNIEKKLFQSNPEYEPTLVSKIEVANNMPENSILIEYQAYYKFLDNPKSNKSNYFSSEKRYLAFLLKPNGSSEAIDLGNADEIDKNIKSALLNIREFPEKSEELFDKISDSILDPINKYLEGINTVFISPDSEINLVPFSALNAPNSQKYLNEIYDMRLLTTGRDLIDRNFINKTSNNKSIIIANPYFGNADYLNSESKKAKRSGQFPLIKWGALNGTKNEGESIKKIINGNLIMGIDATESYLFEQKKPKILHIASHSYYFDLNEIDNIHPLKRSGVVLAGANNKFKTGEQDGYLTALEITTMDLLGTEMVVISGCESGKGIFTGTTGDGIYGLKRAIAVSGAKSSLLSLWKVNDEGTAKFMEYFYRKLKAGSSKVDALRDTQSFFRNHPDKSLRTPFIWAAFQLTGDWEPIKL